MIIRLVHIILAFNPRFRFYHKLKLIQKYSKFNFKPHFLKYILWSDELDTFAYGLTNSLDCIELLAQYFTKSEEKDLLHSFASTEPSVEGRYLFSSILIFLTKPNYIVELGVKDGYGTNSILNSLSSSSNFDAKVFSVDHDRRSGSKIKNVPSLFQRSVYEDSINYLQSLKVPKDSKLVVLSDTAPDLIQKELDSSLLLGVQELFFIYNTHWSEVRLPKRQEWFFKTVTFTEESDHIFYSGRTITMLHFLRK